MTDSDLRITIRLKAEEARHLDQITQYISGAGVTASRIDAVRYVLNRGFPVVDREFNMTKAPPSTTPKSAQAKRGKRPEEKKMPMKGKKR